MYDVLITLINRLDNSIISRSSIIDWGCPVPSFGDISTATVATVGLNPSNREFMDESGNELNGINRRFHTLQSLGIDSWADIDSRHIQMIIESCSQYFNCNPYDIWFNKLNNIISGTNASYYDSEIKACHLDLIPYATKQKWTELDSYERSFLLNMCADTLGLLLRESPIKLLILNGRSVVDRFENVCNITLDEQEMPTWSLNRRTKNNVIGVAYKGLINKIGDIGLTREIMVIGYNHNIQSSFGVTTVVIDQIKKWICDVTKDLFDETR